MQLEPDIFMANRGAVIRALGPAAWFRYQMGITQAGGFASQWDDQSGNGRHLKQATGADQPAVQGDGSILFDGVSDFMKCDPFTLNQPCTIYLLMKQVTWTNADTIFDGDTSLSVNLNEASISPQMFMFAGSNANANGDLAVNTYGAVAAVYDGASSVLQVNNGVPSTGNPGAQNAAGFTLARRGSTAVNFGNIQAKEGIIFTSAHDATTRSIVISYLMSIP